LLLASILAARIYWRSSKIKASRKHKNLQKIGIFRRLVASAVGLISSDLEQWMLNVDRSNTAFYNRLTDILETHDLKRSRTQTQREFADYSRQHFKNHPHSSQIQRIIKRTTEKFYKVRFGDESLTPTESESIAHDLDQLTTTLAQRETAF
jgi:hypothetical protein